MGAGFAWFTTVVLVLIGVVVLYHLGLNLGPSLSTAFHAVLHVLSRPLMY